MKSYKKGKTRFRKTRARKTIRRKSRKAKSIRRKSMYGGEVIVFPEGTYDGVLKDGKKDGLGKLTYNNGDIYDGEWTDDLRDGRGKLTYANGDIYYGDWSDDKKHGQGKQTYANGDIYDGEWTDDLRDGVGKIKYRRGRLTGQEWEYVFVYEGQWNNDKIVDGYGKLIYSEEIVDKNGKLKYLYGDIYEGELKYEGEKFKKHGHGKTTFKNKDTCESDWVDDNPVGKPKWTYFK
jgi:hypothetical protein